MRRFLEGKFGAGYEELFFERIAVCKKSGFLPLKDRNVLKMMEKREMCFQFLADLLGFLKK